MSEHRCAICGSANIITDTQVGGISYNYKKGIVGTVVLGVGGAVAGIENKKQQIFMCQDCGVKLTYEMPESLRNAIDLALVSKDARSYLYADGYGQLSWSVLRKQYKNIEEGLADRLIADKENRRRESLLSYATATKEEFDKAVDLLVDVERRLSCNGSIYDRLPDDAFSDTKPMTLTEYYVWQDAVALFIENAAKYFPYPPAEYRGLDGFKVKAYFGTYLYEKVRIEYGRLPEFTGFKHCEDFKNYAEENPFVLYFADKYFPKTFIPFGSIEREVIPWTPDRFAEIMRQRTPENYVSLIKIKFEMTGGNGEEISIWHTVPRYTVKDGRLGFWRESNPHNRVPDGKGTMDEYFTIYPDKRSVFNEKVTAHKQQLSGKPVIEGKIKSCELAIAGNEDSIKGKQAEIVQLQKKIFGKKAAFAKVAVLEQEIQEIKERNAKHEATLGELKQQLKKIVDDKKFFEQLAEEMDYFIAWRWVEDVTV